jgi:hypothetical protein
MFVRQHRSNRSTHRFARSRRTLKHLPTAIQDLCDEILEPPRARIDEVLELRRGGGLDAQGVVDAFVLTHAGPVVVSACTTGRVGG